ncbi:MAG TPA: hypothetical protein VF215_15510 [Thermoanaerobaculia bacterium]
MNRADITQYGRLLKLRERFDRLMWPLRYRVGRLRRQIPTLLFRRRATRLLRSFLAQHPTAETNEVYTFISTLAAAYGAEWELAGVLRDLADEVKAEGRWQPSDPLSIEDRTKRAEAELRTWMEEHPNTDPRDDSIIDEIAESWVPVYNYERLRVAMESSLWLIAGDVENEAHSAAELLGIAMYEWIRDALYDIAQAKQDTYEPHAI